MTPVQVSKTLFIAGQPPLTDIRQLQVNGFTTLIDNRPDGEEETQPGSAGEKAVAVDAGLGFSFIPVRGSEITEADVRAFKSPFGKSRVSVSSDEESAHGDMDHGG